MPDKNKTKNYFKWLITRVGLDWGENCTLSLESLIYLINIVGF